MLTPAKHNPLEKKVIEMLQAFHFTLNHPVTRFEQSESNSDRSATSINAVIARQNSCTFCI